MTEEQTCSKCGEVKPFSEFHKDKTKPNGIRYDCKICANGSRNHAKDRENSKRWRERNVLRCQEYRKQYRERNKSYGRVYYRKNREKILQYQAERKRANGYVSDKLATRRRAAKMRLLPNILSKREEFEIYNLFDFKCALTGVDDFGLDHFIPYSWGHGGNYYGNVYPLSRSVNASMKDKNPFKWYEEEATHIDPQKWIFLVSILAEQNNLSVEKFKQFVYWCEDNKREVHDIIVGIPSIEIWRCA